MKDRREQPQYASCALWIAYLEGFIVACVLTGNTEVPEKMINSMKKAAFEQVDKP